MPQPLSVAGGRPIPVASKLSVHEAEVMDRLRGPLTRAQFIRWMLLDAEKHDRSPLKPG